MNRPAILVTGASGFLGTRLVGRLVRDGYPVRAFARPGSNVGHLVKLGVEIARGDLGDAGSVDSAARGIEVVVHAGAGTTGTEESARIATVEGTRNVLRACGRNGVRKLVHISSCSVYDVAGQVRGQSITESSPLEKHPDRRGHYSATKQMAEALVHQARDERSFAVTVLRPGMLYGRGLAPYPPMIGVSAGRFLIVFGDGRDALPVTHVDNAVDAILLSIASDAADGEVFNVVDDERISKNRYVEQIVTPAKPRAWVIHLPMALLFASTWAQEKLMAVLRRRPYLTVYRLVSSQKPLHYDNARIKSLLGWAPRIDFATATADMETRPGE